MSNTLPIYIGVSPPTFEQSQNWPPIPSVILVPFPLDGTRPREADTVVGLWRRQHDATAWVTALLPTLPKLMWLHTDTVGVERLPLKFLHERGTALTNARGAFSTPMAEWALCIMLMSSKRMTRFLAKAQLGVWAADVIPSDFCNQTILILGYGSAGRELSRVCRALGIRVICVRRTTRTVEDIEPGVTVISVQENWMDLLPECDFLVVTVPLTEETEGLVDRDVLTRLRPGARLINLARAQVVNEDAMIAALRAGTLAEAWLDVFAVEPLPPEDRLWREPNVYLTPHMSAVGESNESSTRAVFLRELEQFLQGRHPINQINLLLGY
ncbi:MAG: D-2-hydroxyacid dehydrogenase [Candidatus Nitrotoga sp.]